MAPNSLLYVNNWKFSKKFGQGAIYGFILLFPFFTQQCHFPAYEVIQFWFVTVSLFQLYTLNSFSCLHHAATQDPGHGTKFL